MKKKLVFLLEYEVDAEDCNVPSLLDTLAELGSGRVIDVQVVEK